MTTTNGTIKRITDRGFGFIATAEGLEYFFHQSACGSMLCQLSAVRITARLHHAYAISDAVLVLSHVPVFVGHTSSGQRKHVSGPRTIKMSTLGTSAVNG